MRSSNTIKAIGVAIGLLIFSITGRTAIAGGGGSDTPSTPPSVPSSDPSTPSPSPNPSPSPSPSPTTGTTSSSNQFNQQSGIQVNWSGSSTLNPPSCSGGCVFAVTRISPTTYGSGANMEAVVGVTIPIGSNDNGYAEVNRINIEMQKYKTEHDIKLALSEKLADALETGKMERARILAMMLAPWLGYKDYRILLTSVSNEKFTKP